MHDNSFKVNSQFPYTVRRPRNVRFRLSLHALIMASMQNRLDLQLHLVAKDFMAHMAVNPIPVRLNRAQPYKEMRSQHDYDIMSLSLMVLVGGYSFLI